ncbi:MAG: hypothetical protein H0T95_07080 [Chthoniobacterales bacterium]|nr:hypothetical protein [Chthoniobacterales bacterium]
MKVQKIGFVAIPVTEIKRARVQGTSGALAVEDFDAAILKLKVAVIRFAMEPFETPVAPWPWCRIRTATNL